MFNIFKKIDKVHILILLGLCFVFLTTVALAPDGVSRFDSLFIGAEDDSAGETIAVGGKNVFIKGTLEVDGVTYLDGDLDLSSTLTFGGVTWTLPTGAGTNGHQLTTNGTSTLAWAAAGALTYDTIPDPALDSLLTFANDEINKWVFSDVDEPNFLIEGIGALSADVAIVRFEQKTGDPSDGKVLYVKAGDANVDPFVVDASAKANAFIVGQNTGVVTIAGAAEETSALIITAGDILVSDGDLHLDSGDATFDEDVTITGDLIGGTGLINYTNFDVDASGNVSGVAGTFSGAVAGTTGTFSGAISATNATFTGNLAVTGSIKQDALIASTASTNIKLDGSSTTGGVDIGTVGGNGTITMGGSGYSTLVNLPDAVDLTLAGGQLSITDSVNADLITLANSAITSNDFMQITAAGTRTSGSVFNIIDSATTASTMTITANSHTTGDIISLTANALTSGSMLYLDSDRMEATTPAGFYIQCYGGSADDFTVGDDGVVIIAGLAENDGLTLSVGDVSVAVGHIDAATTVANDQNLFSRNVTGSTTSLFKIDDNHTGGTAAALEINQDGDGNSYGILMIHDGDYPAIDISHGVARTTGAVIDISTTNSEATNVLFIDGAWTGASTVGAIEVNPTGNIASGGSMIRLDYDTGTPAGTGFAIDVDDDSLAGSSSYAVLINTANNAALHVQTGVSLFAPVVTFTAQSVHTGGIDSDDPIDVDMNAANETVDITATANSYTAKSGVLMVEHTDGTLTNQQYLVRLQYTDDDNANADFILCLDDSGSNKDELFAVDSDGAIVGAATLTLAGSATINGAALIGDGATTQYGFVAVAAGTGGGTQNLEIADSGKIYFNDGATTYNLPPAAAGLRFTFVVAHASMITIEPDQSDYILILTDTAGDKIESTTVGDTITLFAVGAVNWYVQSEVEDWADAGA